MEYTSAFVTRNPKTKGWRGMVNYKQDGKWKKREKSFPQARNKTEARRLLEDWKKELGFETPSLDVDAMEYALGHIDYKLALQAIQPSSATDYKKSLRGWSPYLDGLRLSGVTRETIETALMDMLSSLSPNTVLKRYVALNMVLSHAVDRGDLPSNPMQGIPRPKQKLSAPNSIQGDELERLKERLAALPLSAWVVGVYLCLYAGLRAEEACGLMLSDIDLSQDRGWVRRASAYGEGGAYVAPPKNGKPRDFPISPTLHDVLERWMDIRPDGPYLLSGEKMLGVRYIGRRWSTYCEIEGYVGQSGQKPTLHDLRHTFATQCVKAGMDVKTLQSILGHSSAAITLDVYASADPGAKAAAGSLIESAI